MWICPRICTVFFFSEAYLTPEQKQSLSVSGVMTYDIFLGTGGCWGGIGVKSAGGWKISRAHLPLWGYTTFPSTWSDLRAPRLRDRNSKIPLTDESRFLPTLLLFPSSQRQYKMTSVLFLFLHFFPLLSLFVFALRVSSPIRHSLGRITRTYDQFYIAM